MTVISIAVAGTPASQGSKNPWGGEADTKLRPWRAAVAFEAKTAMNGRAPIVGPVSVDVVFVFSRPKAHYRTGRLAHLLRDDAPYWHDKKPDADKLARAVGDALSGIVFRDDAQIVEWSVRKIYGITPRMGLRVWSAQEYAVRQIAG
jgi:Holliday junction resolvase RusA-like endonuclease